MKIQPGTFFSNGREYMAVSVVPRRTTLTASEVADVIAAGLVKVQVFSGCKVLSLADVGMLVKLKGGENNGR